jgi:hypothetical protein
VKRVRQVRIILAVVLNSLAITGITRNFVSSDGFHYYSDRPNRLLLVALIAIAGGLLAFSFSTLSPKLQRRIKLVLLGSASAFVMLVGACISYQFAALPALFKPAIPWFVPWPLALGTLGIAGLLAWEFSRVLRTRLPSQPV